MKVWGVAVLCLIATGRLLAQAPAQPPSRVAQANAALDALLARDFGKITSQFDPGMTAAMPGSALGDGWDRTAAQVGALVKRAPAAQQQRGAFTAVVIACDFERAKLEVTIVFNEAGQIAGLQIRPPAAAVAYATPAYAVAGAYTERNVTVGAGEWALPGTLTMPVGSGPFPAVVLVHGSGPNDRDETIGPNKTFKDLALGLGSRGVAVLRYDKRTLVYGSKLAGMAGLTVKDETIDDALEAVKLLKTTAAIDPARIFVIGHSLGATVAPRIGAADPAIAGLVIMAGVVRSLPETIVDQLQYLAAADGTVTPDEQKGIDDARKTVEAVAKLTAADAKSTTMIANAPASYWLDLRGYDPPAAALKLTQRLLILQGARDYQVTTIDYERWHSALVAKPNVEFHLYPALNHLFLPGTGKSLPAEYAVRGHVPVEVIEDIANWIKRPAKSATVLR
jgi:dienelactone hydrolase